MKIYYMIILAFFTALSCYSAEPLIELEQLPSSEQFSQYDDNDLWFQNKLMDYYKTAVIYETQVKALGDVPAVVCITPTVDDLESIEYKILKKYYSVADKLKSQLLSLESGLEAQKIKELQKRIKILETENFTVKDSNFRLSLDDNKYVFYKSRYEEILKNIDSLKISIDSVYSENCITSISRFKALGQFEHNKYAVISISAAANQYYFNNSKITSSLSPGFMLNFNPGRIFGIGRIIDIWTVYNRLEDEVKISSKSQSLDNYTDRFSFGLSLIVPLDRALNIKDFNSDFKVGFGYFHTDTKCPNSTHESVNSDGNIIKLELNVSNFNRFFPFSIFADLDFNKYNKELRFIGSESLNLDKPWVTSFSLGLRFPLWLSINE